MIFIEDRSEEQIEAIISFLKSFRKPFVIGLSGGVDSAVAAKLCSLAGKTKALIMPDEVTPKKNVNDAVQFAESIGIEHELIKIDGVVRAFGPFKNIRSQSNTKARARMVLLYRVANDEDSLVVGAGNKSEIMVGYFTKSGDGNCDILPIGDLYKTEVTNIAHRLGIPDEITEKAPSADLYEGQTDEMELGIDYLILDLILRGFELGMDVGETTTYLSINSDLVKRVENMVRESTHKRSPPVILKLGLRTPYIDWS